MRMDTERQVGGPRSLAVRSMRTWDGEGLRATLSVAVLAILLGLLAALESYAALELVLGLAGALALGAVYLIRRFETLIGLWVFFLLQPALAGVIGERTGPGQLVSAIDIPMLIVVGLVGFACIFKDRSPGRWLLLLGGLAVLACGLASGLASGAPAKQSAVGAALFLKLFLMLAAGLAVPWTPQLGRKGLRIIVAGAVVAAIAGVVDFVSGGVLRGIFAEHPVKAPRLGLIAAGGLFRDVSVLGTFMVIGFTVLLGTSWRSNRTGSVTRLVLFVLAALSTLRLKSIAGIPAAALALAVTNTRARARLVVVIALSAVIAVSAGGLISNIVSLQVGKYSSSVQPRQRLLDVSYEIAREHFPLGVGFGRFGSAPSVWKGEYSPVYARYGLEKYYGFRPKDPISYTLDEPWASLLGETGVSGLLCYLVAVGAIGAIVLRRAQKPGPQSEFASIGFAVLVVLLVDSLSQPTIFDSFITLTTGLIIGPALYLGDSS